ncbi:MAG: hypothetical protein JNL12_15045 [Planctomycetes bacterium]|nr:hypothetical protein [Planctomycetota bacterium]
MNQKSLLLVVALLLFGAVATSLLLAGDGPAPMPLDAERSTATASGDAVSATGDQERGLPSDAMHSGEAASVERAEAAATTGSRPLPEDAKWLVVTVLDKATSTPVAGARVFWSDETLHEYLGFAGDHWDTWSEELQVMWRDPLKMAERGGWSAITDQEGKVRVTLREQTTVGCRHEGRYGLLQLRKNTVPPPNGHRLLLEPDQELRVHVVTADDRPAAKVPINLAPYGTDGRMVGYFAWQPFAFTDTDGDATIPHVRALLEQLATQDEAKDQQVTWRVRAMLPGSRDGGVVVDMAALPSEPVLLRLPPTGRIRVRAEFQQQPLPGFRHAFLQEDADDEELRYPAHRLQKAGPDGAVVFEHVPLGRRFYTGSYGIALHQEFRGPTAVDQQVEVLLEPRQEISLWRGRLLLPDGTPAAGLRANLQLRGPSVEEDEEFRTDAEGRFLIAAGRRNDADPDEAGRDYSIQSVRVLTRPKDEPPLQGTAAPRTLRTGIEDLGDLRLERPPVVVAGRLLCGEQPFRGQIHLEIRKEQPAEGRRPVRWVDVDEARIWQNREGRFAAHGELPPGRYRLHASTEAALPIEPVEFRLGTEDLVVQIDLGSPVAASVLLPERTQADLVAAWLLPATTSRSASVTTKPRELRTSPELQSGERFDLMWPAVPSGTYTLELRTMTRLEPLVTIPDLQVPPPEGGDPRLVDIDLRGLVRTCTLALHDQDGKPLERAYGCAFPFGQVETARWDGQQFHEQPATLLLPPGPVDLLLAVQGFRPQRVSCLGERLEVRLDPWPTVEVRPPAQELPAGAHFTVRLQQATQGASEANFRSQWGGGNRSEFFAPSTNWQVFEEDQAKLPIGDGIYQLQIRIRQNGKSVPVPVTAPTQVLSTDGRIVPQVTAEAWQKATEQLKKQLEQTKNPTPR